MHIEGMKTRNEFGLKESSTRGENLAKAIMLFADKYGAAVSDTEFQVKLERLKTLSSKELVAFIRAFDKDESVIELICDEVGNGKEVRKEACRAVFDALAAKASDLGIEHLKDFGIDTSDFRKLFNDELDARFSFLGKYVKTDKLDSIINALTQAIENRQNLTQEDIDLIKNTPAEEKQTQTNNIIEKRLEKVYSTFGERVDENGNMVNGIEIEVPVLDENGKETGEFTKAFIRYDGQLQEDGIAADIADFLKGNYKKILSVLLRGNLTGLVNIEAGPDSENCANAVRADLKIADKQLKELREASMKGEEAYAEKFYEVFGIKYDYANIVAYQKAEETYINASAKHENELATNKDLKRLLSPAPLSDEYEYTSMPSSAGGYSVSTLTATKEDVFAREYEILAKIIGAEKIENAFAESNKKTLTLEDKFDIMKNLASEVSKKNHAETINAGGGKEFVDVQSTYERSYKAAYGVENDVMKRVTDYCTSQQIGASLVKAGTVMAGTIATMASGGSLGAAALVTSGVTVGAEVIDRATSGNALHTLREQGVNDWVVKTIEDVDWNATLKQAAMSGAAVFAGGKIAEGVTIAMKGATPVAQATAMFGSDVAFDAAMEYVMTGEVTIQGMAFTVAFSLVGNAWQLCAIKKAGAAADAVKAADVPTPKADIDFNARLGSANSMEDFNSLLRNATTVDEVNAVMQRVDKFPAQFDEGDLAIFLESAQKIKKHLSGLDVIKNMDVPTPKADLDFNARLGFANSIEDFNSLLRNATTVDEVNAVIHRVDKSPVQFDQRDLAIFLDRAQDKKRILSNSKASRVVETKTEIRLYDEKGNIKEVRLLDDGGTVYHTNKYAPDGTVMPGANSSSAQAYLDNAGFNADVRRALNKEFGSEFTDQVLDMIMCLEVEVASGKPVTKELVLDAINRYSDANTLYGYQQRNAIANYWAKGDDVYRAFGQTPPVKYSVDEFFENTDIPGQKARVQISETNPDVVTVAFYNEGELTPTVVEISVEKLSNYGIELKTNNPKYQPVKSTESPNEVVDVNNPNWIDDIDGVSTKAAVNNKSVRERLMDSKTPDKFVLTELTDWAAENGFTVKISGEEGKRVVEFFDDNLKSVRCITEDHYNPGKVYDDRIAYYENGKHVAGKQTYNGAKFSLVYDVAPDGNATNIRKISL